MHEVNLLDFMPIEAGALYVMDLGYLDVTRLYAMHQAGRLFLSLEPKSTGTLGEFIPNQSTDRQDLFAIKRFCSTAFMLRNITQKT